MSSVIEGYTYDIFISYRQKDNRHDGWVSEFVKNLKGELEAAFKEDISVYFDENPDDRLSEYYQIKKSLDEKLRCLIFIPILSQTYCDPDSYAWKNELLIFRKLAEEDHFGKEIRLKKGNYAGRILPVRIYDLDPDDVKLFEHATGCPLRSVDFVFKTESGVNRPLRHDEIHPQDNLNKTFYNDQLNKTVNAIKEIISGMKCENQKKNPEEKSLKKRFETPVQVEKSGSELLSKKATAAIIVGVLLFITVIYLLPDFLKHDNFDKIRNNEGKISIVVLPFENLTGDTSLNWFERGISSLIINGLGASKELSVLDDQTLFDLTGGKGQVFTTALSPSKAREVAVKARSGTYITGSFQGSAGKYRVLSSLVNTETGDIICTKMVDGDLKSSNYLEITDSLCREIKNYLEIKALEESSDYDFKDAFPASADAYRYFIEGLNSILASDYESAVISLKRAYDRDSTFTLAAFYSAFAYSFNYKFVEACDWTRKAYFHKEKLPANHRNWLEMWYACYINKSPEDVKKYCDLLANSEMESRFLWFDLGVTYRDFLSDPDKSITAFRRVDEISSQRGDEWKYARFYVEYCISLINNNKFDEASEIVERGLNVNPGNKSLTREEISLYLLRGDTISARKSFSAFKQNLTRTKSESYAENSAGLIYLMARDTSKALEFFKRSFELDQESPKDNFASIWYLVKYGTDINYINKGLALAQKILKDNPDDDGFLWIQGIALGKKGEYEEAFKSLVRARDLLIGYNIELEKDIKKSEKALSGKSGVVE
jgi:TolB-like protein